MEKKVFGYPAFNASHEMVLTTYDNEYSDMLMDIRVYKMKAQEERIFYSEDEECAILLLQGHAKFSCETLCEIGKRSDVFMDGPYAMHVSKCVELRIHAIEDSEILVQKAKNENVFASRFYTPEDAPWKWSSKGCFHNTASRRVNTIFDYDIQPASNMVLGEVINDSGNWSGYLPHRHEQPECYFFLFDHEEGFGASFVGDQVFKSVDHSFSAIPGGCLHPQSCAPGFQLYTCWMIAHLPNNPWLQSNRCEDERYTWLHDAPFDTVRHSFVKK